MVIAEKLSLPGGDWKESEKRRGRCGGGCSVREQATSDVMAKKNVAGLGLRQSHRHLFIFFPIVVGAWTHVLCGGNRADEEPHSPWCRRCSRSSQSR